MVEDVVKSLGFLCLGSRFKRIGERLQADTKQILEELGVTIQAAQFPFLAAIERSGPLTIGELAQSVGITQPGATRTVSQLLEMGYVEMQASATDQRQRLISLTSKGQDLVDYSKRAVWPRIENAVTELCGDLAGPILDQLAAIENGLAEAPLVRRGTLGQERRQ